MIQNCTLAATAALALAFSAPALAEDAPDLSPAVSGEYAADAEHAYIQFSYLHQGYSRPLLRWGDFDATLDWNQDDPAASSVDVVIDATSVDSGVERFNGHLQGENMFDTANFPTITFKSTSVEKTSDTTGKVTGDLTIKDVTKPVTLDVTFNKAGATRDGGAKVGFSGATKLNRSDWGLGFLVPMVGDEVSIQVEIEFVKGA